MLLALVVGVAASVGAVCRYLLDQVVQHQHDQSFPWGTFMINVSGSFLLGLVTGWAAHAGLPRTTATVLGVGLLGGYTTWSTYLWESFALGHDELITEGLVVIDDVQVVRYVGRGHEAEGSR